MRVQGAVCNLKSTRLPVWWIQSQWHAIPPPLLKLCMPCKLHIWEKWQNYATLFSEGRASFWPEKCKQRLETANHILRYLTNYMNITGLELLLNITSYRFNDCSIHEVHILGIMSIGQKGGKKLKGSSIKPLGLRQLHILKKKEGNKKTCLIQSHALYTLS